MPKANKSERRFASPRALPHKTTSAMPMPPTEAKPGFARLEFCGAGLESWSGACAGGGTAAGPGPDPEI
eukprot:7185335-Lingulodinium_polyedra.AAC.1